MSQQTTKDQDARVDGERRAAGPTGSTAPGNEADRLIEALGAMRTYIAWCASRARKTDSGTGSNWELRGYAEILQDAAERIRRHAARTRGVDGQIARERAGVSNGR